MSGGRKFATAAARARRHLRRRDARRFEARVDELWAESDWTRAYCRAWLLDPRNETLCDECGWTNGMVCPECERGCGCETRCSGWRHNEWGNDDDTDTDWLDEDEDPYWYYKLGTLCSGCGQYVGRCSCNVVVELQDGTTRVLPPPDVDEDRRAQDLIEDLKYELPEPSEPEPDYEGSHQ